MDPRIMELLGQYDPSGQLQGGIRDIMDMPIPEGGIPNIPSGTASVAKAGVAGQIALLKAMSDREKVLEEIQARFGVSKERAAQMHQQMMEKLSFTERSRRQNKILDARLRKVEAEREFQLRARQQAADLSQIEAEANRIVDQVRSDPRVVGPNSPAAQAAIGILKDTRYTPIQGALRAESLRGELDAKLNAGMLDLLAAEQAEWTKLGIGKKWDEYAKGRVGVGPESAGTGRLEDLKTRYQQGESPAAIMNEWRTAALDDSRRERISSLGARQMERRGIEKPLIEEFKNVVASGGNTEQMRTSMREAPQRSSSMKTSRTMKRVGVGAVAAALLYKLLAADKPKQEVPQAMQMALMQQMLQRGGGGASASPEATEGRQLMNMQRTLGIMKMLNDMRAMNVSGTPEAMVY